MMLSAWGFTPVLYQLIHYAIGALIFVNILPHRLQGLITFTKVLPLFVLNLFILAWACKVFSQTSKFSHKNY